MPVKTRRISNTMHTGEHRRMCMWTWSLNSQIIFILPINIRMRIRMQTQNIRIRIRMRPPNIRIRMCSYYKAFAFAYKIVYALAFAFECDRKHSITTLTQS